MLNKKQRWLTDRPRGERQGSGPPYPLKNHKNKGFLSKSGPDCLKNHKTTNSAFNVHVGHHRPANETPFKWRFAGGPMMAHFSGIWSSLPHNLKALSEFNPLCQNLLDPHMDRHTKYICLPACLSVCLPVCLPACMSIDLSKTYVALAERKFPFLSIRPIHFRLP